MITRSIRHLNRHRERFQSDEAGQSLVEFTLVASLLLLPILGGIVYIGAMVIMQENLAVTARHVARKAAFDSQARAYGNGAKSGPASATSRTSALNESATGSKDISLKGVNWVALAAEARGPGSLTPIDSYTAQLAWTAPITVRALDDGNARPTSYQMGLGVLYHGATVERTYTDLAPIGRLANLITPAVSATSVMPTELTPRGEKRVKGVLELNSWITGIVNEPAPPLP